MTETLTIPAHIENGKVQLDAPLPHGVERIEVRVQVSSTPKPLRSVADFIRALPPGTRSGDEIDEQIRGERESWER